MQDPVIIGRFGRVFGIKGWIYVISFTDPKENILTYSPWWIMGNSKEKEDWQKLIITHHRLDEKGIKVKLDQCESPEEAQSFVNKDIVIPQSLLPPLNPEQYYWSELIGLLVKNQEGIILGTIDRLFETGSNDVMVVKGEKEHLIPFLAAVVLKVNREEKEMIVDWDADF